MHTHTPKTWEVEGSAQDLGCSQYCALLHVECCPWYLLEPSTRFGGYYLQCLAIMTITTVAFTLHITSRLSLSPWDFSRFLCAFGCWMNHLGLLHLSQLLSSDVYPLPQCQAGIWKSHRILAWLFSTTFEVVIFDSWTSSPCFGTPVHNSCYMVLPLHVCLAHQRLTPCCDMLHLSLGILCTVCT